MRSWRLRAFEACDALTEPCGINGGRHKWRTDPNSDQFICDCGESVRGVAACSWVAAHPQEKQAS